MKMNEEDTHSRQPESGGDAGIGDQCDKRDKQGGQITSDVKESQRCCLLAKTTMFRTITLFVTQSNFNCHSPKIVGQDSSCFFKMSF